MISGPVFVSVEWQDVVGGHGFEGEKSCIFPL